MRIAGSSCTFALAVSSSVNARSVVPAGASWASRSSAARASHASRSAPPASGGSSVRPRERRMSRTVSTNPLSIGATDAAAQLHDGLPHLGHVEEASAAEHGRRDARVGERRDEFGGLGVCAIEHRDVARVGAGGDLRADPRRDGARLRAVVLERRHVGTTLWESRSGVVARGSALAAVSALVTPP